MKKHSKYLFVGLIFSIKINYAQDLNKIGKKDMVTVNGGLNLNTIYLNTNNPNSTRDPFSWYANGNISVNALGWSFPFSYQISNQSRTYSQPFNQYAIAPTYKWVKLYAGWTNLTFSPYTLSGYPFFGGGVELSPKNWKVTMLYGQFKKTVEYNAEEESYLEMSYKRLGLGTKVEYNAKGYSVFGAYFKAKDVVNSLAYVPEEANLYPQEGTVISGGGKAPLGKKLNIDGEYAYSSVTRNSLSEGKAVSNVFLKSPLFSKQFVTTQNYAAYKTGISFNEKYFGIAANYERVDPGYTTLGAFYFNNDLENFTLAPQLRLFKSKLNLSGNAGLQKNNLDETKLNTTSRWVGAVNFNFVPNTHWVITGAYSNFTSFTRNRPNTNPFYTPTPADTLQFYQLSQSGNGFVSYNFNSGKIKNSVSLNVNQVSSASAVSNVNQGNTNVFSANFSYSLIKSETRQNLSFTANYNNMQAPEMLNVFYGPGLNYSRSFLKNTLNLSIGSIFNNSFTNNKSNGMVFSERLNVSFNPKVKKPQYGKPSISFSCNYVNKPAVVSNGFTLSEFTGNLNLSYGF